MTCAARTTTLCIGELRASPAPAAEMVSTLDDACRFSRRAARWRPLRLRKAAASDATNTALEAAIRCVDT